MEQPPGLTDPRGLSDLIRALEPQGKEVEAVDPKLFAGAISVSSQEDPGQRICFLVPATTPESRGADGVSRWLRERRDALAPILRETKAALCTVIFAGDWPSNPIRDRVGRTRIRVISATGHIWIDRLRCHDEAGNLDDQARRAFLQRLSSNWSADEERFYTAPAIREVDSQSDGSARQLILRNQPDLLAGTVSVVYGPGGIGKTFFLRRVANRMTRVASADMSLGVPVFAELPLLLTTDTLEAWLSHRGMRLRLEQIRALIAAGVVIPLLDALDELVRGQAREGSRAFLHQLGRSSQPSGRILLSSRDYYLNLDPLVREGLEDSPSVELVIGYFTKEGRRRYVQIRTGLGEAPAARWASQLEEQAIEALGGMSESDVETLIGHPLFLDAFCAIILNIPEAQRATAAEDFRIASPDVFGEIVTKVLEREESKVQPAWDAKMAPDLTGDWRAPFSPAKQQSVLRSLVLRVARDGGREAYRRSLDDERYRELLHGLFTFTTGVEPEDGETRRDIVRNLVQQILGQPTVADHVSREDLESTRHAALDEYAGFLLQHTLSDTRPNLVEELVFATRHRAYFDYILADALLGELESTLRNPTQESSEQFIEWCLAHHIFERPESQEAEPPFASCLDFVLWHREALDQAIRLIDQYFRGPDVDDVLGSYVLSLGLAVLLRATLRTETTSLDEMVFAPDSAAELEIIEAIVPAIAGLDISRVSVGNLALSESRLNSITVEESDFRRLSIRGSKLSMCTFRDVHCESLSLSGTIHMSDSVLDIEVPLDEISLEPSLHLMVERCVLRPALLQRLEEQAQIRPDAVSLRECRPAEEPSVDGQTPGRQFVNKLMALTRRHGHDEYAVFSPKLRGRSRASAEQYPDVLRALRSAGAIEYDDEMVYLTSEAARHRYAGKARPGLRTFADVAAYWDPIVEELDKHLS